MRTLYGTARSRASRSILALEELGLAYTHTPWGAELRTPSSPERAELSRLNPNSRIPVLDDDGLVLWESMAINLYLADRYPNALWPGSAVLRGQVHQWSFWAQTEIDRRDWAAARGSGEERIRAVTAEKTAALGILDSALASRPYLLGEQFSLAELNVAATLSEPHEGGRIDWQRLDPFELGLPNLGGWLARCTGRDSWRRVADLP